MKTHSHLTRQVFKALISNRPYVSRECLCLRRPVPSTTLRFPQAVNFQQRRHFLDALLGTNKTPRVLHGQKPTAKNFDAAVDKLVDLLQARRSRSRTPAHEQLIDALRFLFSARLEQQRPLTRNEVFLVSETYKHLQERDWILSEHANCVAEDDLSTMLQVLALSDPTTKFRFDIRALAELIFTSLNARGVLSIESENLYLTILARNGSAISAQEKVTTGTWPPDHQLLVQILKGLIAEAYTPEFWSLLEKWERENQGLTRFMHQEVVIALLQADRVRDARKVYDMPIINDELPSTECMCRTLEAMTKSGSVAFADELASLLTTRLQEPHVIHSLLIYNAVKNPRLDNIRDILYNMLHASNSDISITTFNNIVEYTLSRNQPHLAWTIQNLATADGFHPDGKSHALRLAQALDAGNSGSASKYFELLLNDDVPSDNYDVKVLNRYLSELCFSPDPSHEQVMRVADRILERDSDFDVEAIAGLSHVFLTRGDMDDAVGLLRYRTDFLPPPDRARISRVFTNFIANAKIKDQQAFNAYELFRVAFPETSSTERLPLMQHFFNRKRPDLACLVFSHMRQAAPEDYARPDADAYTKCFEGLAQCRDVDGLQSIYNMLKLDLQVELTTKIRNALMLANIACQTPWVAIIDHFYKIMDSREGPSYSTFEVALRACETWPPYGSFEARKIMAIMQSWNLEITKPLYDNYVGVMAGQCEFESAVELIEHMYEDMGAEPDAFTIGTFYNAIPWQFRKDEVEKWAKVAYPELWAQLETFGDEIDEEWEVRYFKLDRSIDIDDPPLFADGTWKPELQREVQAQIEPLPMTR